MNTTETNLIFEAYAKSKPLNEGYEDNESREKNIMRGKDAISAEQDSYYEQFGAEAFEEHYGFAYPQAEDEEGEGNIFERLEAFMRSNPEAEQELTPILNDFQDIIEDINSLDAQPQATGRGADEYKVDATDLGIHLNRLFPDV